MYLLLANPPNVTQEPITRIISKQLGIKLGPFNKEEVDSVLRKIKNRKAAGLSRYNTYIHSSQKLQCPTTKPHSTLNRQNPEEKPKWLQKKQVRDLTNIDHP